MINKIRNSYSDYVIRRCRENNCQLKNIRSCVILDGDDLLPNVKSCDCIVIEDPFRNRAILVELKSDSINVDSIIKKFENSSMKTIEIIETCQPSLLEEIDFFHILLTKSGLRTHERKKMQRTPIRVNNNNFYVTRKQCGCDFVDIT